MALNLERSLYSLPAKNKHSSWNMSNHQHQGHGQLPDNVNNSLYSANNNHVYQNGQQMLPQQGNNSSFPVAPLSVPPVPILNAGNAIQYPTQRPYIYHGSSIHSHQGVSLPRPMEQRTNGVPFPSPQLQQAGPPRLQDTGRIQQPAMPYPSQHAQGSMVQENRFVPKPAPVAHQVPDTGKRLKTEAVSTASQRALEREAALRELARFRKRKMDYKLPEKTASLLPDSSLFAQLQDVERRVDNEIYRRKNEILELFGISSPMSENEISLIGAARRQMRVYIFGQKSNKNGEDIWSLTIHGRPIESAEGSHPGGGGSTSQSLHVAKLFFCHCLKSLQIEFQGKGFEHDTILWQKCKHDRDLRESRFQVHRSGPPPSLAKITMEIDHAKPMYTVPEKLEKVLNLPSGLGRGVYSIAYVMGHLWNHAKKNNLLIQVGDIGKIKLDDTLKEVAKIGYETKGKVFHADDQEYISYTAMGKCIQGMLTPTKPFTLEYDMSNPDPYKPLCVDFHYEAPLVSGSQAIAPSCMLEARNVYQAEMEELDVDLAELYHRYCDMESAHAILQSFALDPHRTLREILALHNKDPRSLPQKSDEHLEIMTQSAPYKDPWVDDAILRYLADTSGELRRIQQKIEADKLQQQIEENVQVKEEPRQEIKNDLPNPC